MNSRVSPSKAENRERKLHHTDYVFGRNSSPCKRMVLSNSHGSKVTPFGSLRKILNGERDTFTVCTLMSVPSVLTDVSHLDQQRKDRNSGSCCECRKWEVCLQRSYLFSPHSRSSGRMPAKHAHSYRFDAQHQKRNSPSTNMVNMTLYFFTSNFWWQSKEQRHEKTNRTMKPSAGYKGRTVSFIQKATYSKTNLL